MQQFKSITSHYIHREEQVIPLICEAVFYVLEDCYHVLSKHLLDEAVPVHFIFPCKSHPSRRTIILGFLLWILCNWSMSSLKALCCHCSNRHRSDQRADETFIAAVGE